MDQTPLASPSVRRPAPDWSVAVGSGMRLSVWTIEEDYLNCRLETEPPRFSFRLILSGEVECRLGRSSEYHLEAPRVCVAAQIDRSFSVSLLGQHTPLRIISIDFPDDTYLPGSPVEVQKIVQAFHCPLRERCPMLLHSSPSAALTSLGTQMITCPLQGMTREIYLSGMALQLLALGIECLAPTVGSKALRRSISPRDVERFECVKCILKENIKSPPPLVELARGVGLTQKRLALLFRELSGVDVLDYVQQCRFEQAFNLLVHTNLQIAEIAYHIGYTPAHFSTAFKKRFGRLPSDLRSQGS